MGKGVGLKKPCRKCEIQKSLWRERLGLINNTYERQKKSQKERTRLRE